LVETVRGFVKGKRGERLDASVAAVNESLAKGGWVERGSARANTGFYQGLVGKLRWGYDFASKDQSSLYFCLQYGKRFAGNIDKASDALSACWPSRDLYPHHVEAWIALCDEYARARAVLDAARPLPRITKVGLSPKVTATLKKMNMDIDLPSIRMAKIGSRQVPGFDMDTGEAMYNLDGSRRMDTVYFVEWSEGVVHGRSRFSEADGCHACGKRIPSGMFVPVEATDNSLGKTVSLWLGCDCARNIFGVKDIGVQR